MFGVKTRLQNLGRHVWRHYLSRDPRDRMVPPPELLYVGLGDFRKIGEEHLRYFIDDCGLMPDHHVLDVGCGIGRMAIPMTQYLSPSGSYTGFDIVEPAVEWCRKAITPRYPKFHFDFFDLYNGGYNTVAESKAATFRFPYRSDSYDFICAVSVFTHLVPADAENYLREMARLAKPGGRIFTSFYMYDDEAARLVAEGKTSLPFLHDFEGTRIVDPEEPEHAIAFSPKHIRSLFQAAGLEIVGPIKKGLWCVRESGLDYQDIVIARHP